MNFELLIKEIEKVFGFENMTADENNELTLSSNNIIVTIKQDMDHFIFLTRICSLPDNPLALYKLALSQNDFAKLNAYFSINERDSSLVMTTKFPTANLFGEIIINKLENHFLSAESFIAKMQEIQDIS